MTDLQLRSPPLLKIIYACPHALQLPAVVSALEVQRRCSALEFGNCRAAQGGRLHHDVTNLLSSGLLCFLRWRYSGVLCAGLWQLQSSIGWAVTSSCEKSAENSLPPTICVRHTTCTCCQTASTSQSVCTFAHTKSHRSCVLTCSLYPAIKKAADEAEPVGEQEPVSNLIL